MTPSPPSSPSPEESQDKSLCAQWLAAWQGAPRIPILYSDRPAVWRMLAAAWTQETVEFRYWRGETPGSWRRFRPRTVFQVEGFPSFYVEGYCLRRDALRTLNLEAVQWPGQEPALAWELADPDAAAPDAPPDL